VKKFAFEIIWSRNGSLERLFEPDPVSLPSIETARELAMRFASYVPALDSITIKAEDGSILERWSWSDGEWGVLPQRTGAVTAGR
jgi:hypothetical protein